MLTPVTPPCSLIIRQLENCAQADHRPCNTPTPHFSSVRFSSVQFSHSLSHVRLFATPWTTAHQASLSITNSRSLLRLMSTESMMPFNHLILCRPLLLPPPISPGIRVFSNESVLCNRWPKYWNFNFNISPSNEYSRLISFRMDWLNLLAVQGTLKSLLQHHSSKASILRCSAFFPMFKVREFPHLTWLKIYLFLIGGELLCSIVLVSAIHWYESAIGIHMSPPSWTSLPPPTPLLLLLSRFSHVRLCATRL